jgi:hypothetical protein
MSNGKYPQREGTFRGLRRNAKRDDVLAGVADLVNCKDLKFGFIDPCGRNRFAFEETWVAGII